MIAIRILEAPMEITLVVRWGNVSVCHTVTKQNNFSAASGQLPHARSAGME